MKKKYLIFFILFNFFLFINKMLVSAPFCSSEIKKNITKEIGDSDQSEIASNDEENNKDLKEETASKSENQEEEDKDIEISADKKIEVDKDKGVMIATGNAFVKKGVTTLSADMLTAFMCETKNGDTRIIQINADINVKIISDQGNAFAKRGIYFVEKERIELYENVKLEKDGDILVGDKGEFNVNTGKGEISTIPIDEGGSKKVYGIIKSKKK